VTTHFKSPRFVCRFAVGNCSERVSGVWQITSGRKKPDLYISVGRAGQVKASIHCPRPDRETWKRHYRFDREAPGAIADSLRSAGRIRDELSWPGADFGVWGTLECRIFFPASALAASTTPVDEDVVLIAPPVSGRCLIVALLLGSAQSPSGYPTFSDAETMLLVAGSLADGRPVWVTYCYAEPPQFPAPEKPGRGYGNRDELLAAKEPRAAMVGRNSDGSLAFLDVRVEHGQLPITVTVH
jgi:hypothetical protein